MGEFSKFKDNLGTLDLRVRRTRRYRLRIRVREDVVASGLSVGELPEWARVHSQTLPNNFPKLRENDAKIVGDIRHIPELFMSDYHHDVSILSPGNIGEMKQLQTNGSGKVYAWERWEDNSMQHVLVHEREFKERMEAYYHQLNQYNDKIQALAPGTTLEAPEMQTMQTIREGLMKKTKDFYQELLTFRAHLISETSHLVAGESDLT